jgi:hypothetical protein
MSTLQSIDFLKKKDAAVTATKVLVKSGAVDIRGITVYNPGMATAFLQLFDAAQTADVTLGSTAFDEMFMIPAGSQIVIEPENKIYNSFALGLVYAATDTATGSNAPAVALNMVLKYR